MLGSLCWVGSFRSNITGISSNRPCNVKPWNQSLTYSTAAGKKIGFIGLGNMGAKMAANLIKAGNSIVVYDINTKAVEELGAKGAESVNSPAELADKVSNIITMLPSSPHVKEVYLNPNTGLIKNMKSGSLLIDSSTIDPATAREVAQKVLTDRQAQFIDAPVSGGVLGAEAATLTFMVGASIENFEKVKPILQQMGKNITHCGGTGTGQVAKYVIILY